MPASPPNWIFPFASLKYYSAANINQFQYLMYRPLYWLSDNGKPVLNTSVSLAEAPEYSDGHSVVTIRLKGWKWSNGTTVDAQDVVFFMNLLRSERDNWAGYAPGELPDNVVAVTAASATSEDVSIHFNSGYNTTWILFNELSQITPLPLAWDISNLEANGSPAPPESGGCSSMTWDTTTRNDCVTVWTFLTDRNGQSGSPLEAGDLATYATNPLWQVVNGPWRLKSFSVFGAVTMVPNTHYSGPVKPHVGEFVEVPFTSDPGEYLALENHALTVGYLPVSDAPPAPSPGEVGPNAPALASAYQLGAQFSWEMNYLPINFNSTGDGGVAGAIFHQLYIRQAFQELIDQPEIMSSTDNNYAMANDGPVPNLPASTFLSSAEEHNPFPYNPSAAERLLTSHGWKVTSGGTDVCTALGGCGSGVPKGSKLSFTLVYYDGALSFDQQIREMARTWDAAGVHVATKGEPFDNILATGQPCKPSPSCSWEIVDWETGWLYQPDFDPTGEYVFQTGGLYNFGSYSDPTNDHLITETITANKAAVFEDWENYVTDQLPVLWQPSSATIVEFSKSLRGVEPFDPYSSINPEDWYFAS